MKTVAENKRAQYDYAIKEEIEAGIVLTAKEARAVRENRLNLTGSFAKFMGNELWLLNTHIGNSEDPERRRKLLLKKNELRRLRGKLEEKGMALVPIRAYFKNNVLKILLGLGKGLKEYDKREKIKQRDIERQLQIKNLN